MCETSTHLWLTSAALPGRPYALHNNRACFLQPQLTCTICSPQNMTPTPRKLGLGLTLCITSPRYSLNLATSLHTSHLSPVCNTKLLSFHHSDLFKSVFWESSQILKFGLHLTEETPILLSFLLSLSAVYLPTVGVLSYCRTSSHPVGLLWTRDRPAAETSTSQHTTLNTNRTMLFRRNCRNVL